MGLLDLLISWIKEEYSNSETSFMLAPPTDYCRQYKLDQPLRTLPLLFFTFPIVATTVLLLLLKNEEGTRNFSLASFYFQPLKNCVAKWHSKRKSIQAKNKHNNRGKTPWLCYLFHFSVPRALGAVLGENTLGENVLIGN